MKFSIKDFFRKCAQIRRKLRVWSHLLKKSLMETLFFLCSDGRQNHYLQSLTLPIHPNTARLKEQRRNLISSVQAFFVCEASYFNNEEKTIMPYSGLS